MKTTIIRVDFNKLMAEMIKEIEKERKLYPWEIITPSDVIQKGFCYICGFKLMEGEEGNCRVCEEKYYGKGADYMKEEDKLRNLKYVTEELNALFALNDVAVQVIKDLNGDTCICVSNNPDRFELSDIN